MFRYSDLGKLDRCRRGSTPTARPGVEESAFLPPTPTARPASSSAWGTARETCQRAEKRPPVRRRCGRQWRVLLFRRSRVILAALALLLAGCQSGPHRHPARSSAASSQSPVVTADQSASPLSTRAGAVSAVPHFDHIVVAVVENHSYGEVLGTGRSRFLDSLAATGAVLTESYAVTHPSEPNYLALFSGSTQGLSDDSCPHSYSGPNLASALTADGKTFTGYSEGLPAAGFTGCESGAYVRKHNPWVDFPAVASDLNQPMTSFPSDFTRLPTVSFVIPNLDNDMHDGSVRQGDQWLQAHLGGYARWASTHNSLLIITADEDDRGHSNQIPTIVVGAHVNAVPSSVRVDHYGVLRTILESLDLQPFEQAVTAQPVTTVWSS